MVSKPPLPRDPLMITRTGCCAQHRKPCPYHEGVADAYAHINAQHHTPRTTRTGLFWLTAAIALSLMFWVAVTYLTIGAFT